MAEKAVNTEALKKVEDQLECTICLQPYANPKLLPCFHVFCKHCLEQIVLYNRDGPSLTCPTCRLPIPLSPSGVIALQPAFHINHLLDIRDTLQKAKVSHETLCENCKKAQATAFCHDCGKFTCGRCTKVHQLWGEFREHKVVEISEIQEEEFSRSRSNSMVLYCSKHPKRELKIYCETCGDLACINCTVRFHLGHQYSRVADLLPKHRGEIQAHLRPVREQLETVERALRVLDIRANEIVGQKTAIEGDIHTKIDQIHKALDQRRAELTDQLDQTIQQKLKSLAAQRERLEMIQAQLASCLQYMEGSLTTNTPAEVLAMKEPVIQQIKGIATDLGPDLLAPQETEADLRLVTSALDEECQSIQKVLSGDGKVDPRQCYIVGANPECTILGEKAEFTLETVDKKGQELVVPVEDISAELVHCTDNTTTQCELKSKGKGKYTVTYTPATRGRHQLHINIGQVPIGCSPLPVTIKLPLHGLKIPVVTIRSLSNPKGVAVSDKGHILVGEGGGKNQISVFAPDGQKLRSFGKIHTPWGICLDQHNRILVVGHTDHQIHQFTPNGEHLQSVGSRGNDRLQFRSPVGIVHNAKSQKFYVTEWGNHRVHILNEDLSFFGMFGTHGNRFGQLSNPAGVATDSKGNVYIGDHGNHRIQVFSSEGQFVRVLGTKGRGPGQLDRPHDVYIDDTDTVFVVDFGNDRISVFTTQGQFLMSFGQEYFTDPIGLTMSKDGFVIVSDYTKKSVLMF